MRTLLPLTLALASALASFGQASINDLDPAHKAALESLLKNRPELLFRSEKILTDGQREENTEYFGKDFRPNYRKGDFNKDGLEDFAVLLQRAGKESWLGMSGKKDAEQNPDYYPDYPLTVVIFNGDSQGFKPVFERKFAGPRAAALNFDEGTLYYFVVASDADTTLFIPYGQKYTIGYPKNERYSEPAAKPKKKRRTE